MNQARKRPMHQKVLSMILVLVMLLGLLSVSAFTTVNTTSSGSADSTEFMRIFHLDCGRKYFSVSEIESLIDTASENNYTHVELAIGNDGLRFLLGDMSLNVNGTKYTSKQVSDAIHAGNEKYHDFADDELTQSEMDGIIAHAQSKNISIIPLINTPGHMDAVIYAMQELGMSGVSYKGSKTTIDVTNSTAVNFTKELLQLYVNYFADKGCKYFNMGADEYANDIYTTGGMGFGQLINVKKYAQFAGYVNSIAAIIKKSQMTPMAFNDGIYYNETTTNGNEQVSFDKDIVICYWTAGYPNGYGGKYSPASASFLASKDLKIINTNDAWYYVLGRSSGSYTLSGAQKGVKNTPVTDVPGNNDPVPIGAMMCLWCDSPSASYTNNDNEQNNVKSLIQTLAASNPTYFTKSTTTDPGTDTGEERTIEISVGETKTDTINGANYENDHTTPDTAIATVTVKGQNEVPGTVDYTNASATYSTLAGNYSAWGQTGYYYKNGDNYYPVYAYAESKQVLFWTTTTYYVGYLVPGSSEVKQLASSTYGRDSVDNLYRRSETEVTPASTTVSFTGVAVGTTYVTVGNVKYTVNVVDKAPSNAMIDTSITLEYWITNYEVYETQSKTGHTKTITTSTDGATADEGIAITDIAPDLAYSFFEGTKDVYYWQAMRLDADHQQTNASGDDETADGTTLTHIRYHGGAWQYKTTDGVWRYFVSTDQLVAYYLQKTEVTKEIDTYAKDWGYATSGTTPDTSSNKGQVALTVAVVYPDGTVSPAEGNMYANSTTIFNYWSNRDIGIVAPKNNSDYNISKITVTDGKRKENTSENRWYTSDTITWNKKTNVAGKEWYDETEVWNKSSGTTPMVNGNAKKITWSAKNTAKLVLIYLEPVEKETNLNVQYIDLNANNYVFHSYQVAMKYNQGDTEPTFTNDLMQGDAVIGDKSPWNSNEVGNTNYLPDDAYVTNSSGTQQMFKKDITTIPEINGIYASGLYKYKKADISEDGKTLRLYYDLNATTGKTFVVDFGLPVEIPFSDFGITNASDVTVSFNEQNTAMTERQGNYGNGKINMTAKTVTYTLTKTLDAKIPIPVYVADKNGNVQMLSVNVIPATSVYYEDSFASFTDGTGNAADAQWTPETDNTGAKVTTTQALTELGKMSPDDVYGHDAAYADSTKLSMGSAHKVTVNADMVKGWTDGSAWPTATFTFRGTGFDVISLTDNTSGTIFVTVTNKATGQIEKRTTVNNYYGYKLENGKWVASPNDPNCLYQIPVIKIAGLNYAEYEVKIQVAYADFLDEAKAGNYSFWLDAIRVYDPMGKDIDTYKQDNEGYPQYIKLHDAIVEKTADIKNAVFVDGGVNAKLDQYKDHGPNNEVYLTHGQAISFKLNGDLGSIASVQIGAKTPNGTGDVATISVNDQDVKTATEMYYAITGDAKKGQLVTIANNGNGILSLTNLKITYKESGKSVLLAPLTTADQENAVAQVRALFAAPAEPFQPDRFEASWGHAVRKGDTATLTVKASEDVDSITVDGQTITAYATKTERTGWGWWAKMVTYREFTYQVAAEETTDYTICAVNSAGVSSDPITATLTVRPSVRDWWHGIFDKWF